MFSIVITFAIESRLHLIQYYRGNVCISTNITFADYFRVDGDTLVTGETPVDFESSDVYTLSITVMDNGIPSLSKEVSDTLNTFKSL